MPRKRPVLLSKTFKSIRPWKSEDMQRAIANVAANLTEELEGLKPDLEVSLDYKFTIREASEPGRLVDTKNWPPNE